MFRTISSSFTCSSSHMSSPSDLEPHLPKPASDSSGVSVFKFMTTHRMYQPMLFVNWQQARFGPEAWQPNEWFTYAFDYLMPEYVRMHDGSYDIVLRQLKLMPARCFPNSWKVARVGSPRRGSDQVRAQRELCRFIYLSIAQCHERFPDIKRYTTSRLLEDGLGGRKGVTMFFSYNSDGQGTTGEPLPDDDEVMASQYEDRMRLRIWHEWLDGIDESERPQELLSGQDKEVEMKGKTGEQCNSKREEFDQPASVSDEQSNLPDNPSGSTSEGFSDGCWDTYIGNGNNRKNANGEDVPIDFVFDPDHEDRDGYGVVTEDDGVLHYTSAKMFCARLTALEQYGGVSNLGGRLPGLMRGRALWWFLGTEWPCSSGDFSGGDLVGFMVRLMADFPTSLPDQALAAFEAARLGPGQIRGCSDFLRMRVLQLCRLAEVGGIADRPVTYVEIWNKIDERLRVEFYPPPCPKSSTRASFLKLVDDSIRRAENSEIRRIRSKVADEDADELALRADCDDMPEAGGGKGEQDNLRLRPWSFMRAPCFEATNPPHKLRVPSAR